MYLNKIPNGWYDYRKKGNRNSESRMDEIVVGYSTKATRLNELKSRSMKVIWGK
ncbi:hypothetical protein GCM10011514_54010 [Emticicia aquatilis]|uniref:Uncharacterized protein n=1 Tax=Emticicia aquatilis TaxID=1537369 RepID=A0A916Z9Q0_9BACT|nr:hypothetical protein [Emticicia aquatilis]GGD83169.1 hypothetical protein GCM10011514_54010 [Emticicia aquatilis]